LSTHSGRNAISYILICVPTPKAISYGLNFVLYRSLDFQFKNRRKLQSAKIQFSVFIWRVFSHLKFCSATSLASLNRTRVRLIYNHLRCITGSRLLAKLSKRKSLYLKWKAEQVLQVRNFNNCASIFKSAIVKKSQVRSVGTEACLRLFDTTIVQFIKYCTATNAHLRFLLSSDSSCGLHIY